MSFSVALCTYNGERYIQEQLESIISGTIRPAQIVVCDDQSTDDTAAIIATVAQTSPVPIELHVNDQNLGYVRNFEKAVTLCRHPIIFLSDQDDVWMEQKAERILPLFDNPSVGGVFTDSELTYSDLTPMNQTMLGRLISPEKHRQLMAATPDEMIKILLVRPVVTGATLAFRRSILDAALPFPSSRFFIHDAWLALVIASVSNLVVLDQPLVKYRQHENQQLGLHRPEMVQDPNTIRYPIKRRDYRRFLQEVKTRFADIGTIRPQARSILDEAIAHNNARLSLAARRLTRPFAILFELISGRYGWYSSGINSAAKDLIRPQTPD